MHGYLTIQNRYSKIILFKVLEKRKLYGLKCTIYDRCYCFTFNQTVILQKLLNVRFGLDVKLFTIYVCINFSI